MDEDLAELQRRVERDPADRAALAALTRQAQRAGQAVRGKSLSAWIAALLDETLSSRERSRAVKSLLRFERLAVLPLIEALRSASGAAEERIIRTLGKLGAPAALATPLLEARLSSPSGEVRRAALRALGRIGPPASAALPAMLEAELDILAVEALSAVAPEDPRALPRFEKAAEGGEPRLRQAAFRALWRAGPEGQRAFAHLLRSGPEFARAEALVVLAEVGPEAAHLSEDVTALLGTRQLENIGWYASRTLAAFGPGARPALELALGHGNERVRQHAAQALRWQGRAAREAAPALLAALKARARWQLRATLVAALASVGRGEPEVTATLLELCAGDRDPEVRAAALHELGGLPLTPDIREAVARGCEDPTERVRKLALGLRERLALRGIWELDAHRRDANG